ncbi:hypothetical protein ACTJNK_31435 [Achromobacter anxifer]
MAFRSYNADAEESVRDALALNAEELQLLEQALLLFPEAIFVGEHSQPAEALFLANNSHSLLLAATRIGLTGHASAMFPVLRAALESACYCFLMVNDPSLSEVWRERHTGEAQKKAGRIAFNSAVKTVADKSIWTPRAKAYLTRVYDAMIDNGAHPNPNSIFIPSVVEDRGDHWYVRLNSVYEGGAPMTKWTTFICADITLLVATVLAGCLKTDDESVWERIKSTTTEVMTYRANNPPQHWPAP